MSNAEQMQSPATPSESPLFSESGLTFLARYRFWILAVVWLGVRGYTLWGLSPNYYVQSYFELAGDWLGGFTPYSDFKVEYPPGALLLFVVPRIFTEAPVIYGYIFAAVMLLADLGILLILGQILGVAAAGDLREDTTRRFQSTLLCLGYIALSAVFGRLLYQGDDLIIALLLLTALYASLLKRSALVDSLLAVAIWVSLYALLWIPLLWWFGIVSRDDLSGSRSTGKFMPALVPRAAVLAGSLAVLFVPFFVLSGRALGYMAAYHLERGLQLESSLSSILMVAAKLFGFQIAGEFTKSAIHLSGSPSIWGPLVCAVVLLAAILIITVYVARRMMAPTDAAGRGIWLIRGLLATNLALLATSNVFMLQYLLWICPLAALLIVLGQPQLRRVGWQLFSVNLLSVVLFFFFYPNLIELEFLPALLLLIRNLFVAWLAVSVLRPHRPAADQPGPLLRMAPRARQILIWLPVLLLFAWGTVAAFRPVRNADIWMSMREGADIVASGKIPLVDNYSAVAAGRPYLAHEWLSGIIFHGIFKLGGGQGLTVFRALCMLAMLLLLWFSLEQRARSFILTPFLLALAAYVILERVFVRPHIFTLLFLCVWVFTLEHWRRRRQLRYLILLVPLQILWANVHGGYIMALVLGAMMTGTAAFLVWVPSWSRNESYTWSDVRVLAGLTAACLAASLVNPHGLRLLEFSLNIGLASDYIKQFVYEWGSPFADNYRLRAYGSDVVGSLFILMWLGLALTAKRRPLADALIAVLASVMTAQAIRFVSFIGLLGFSVTARAWLAVADTYARPALVKRRPLLEAALFALIIASTLIYGFPYDKANHRRIGWGFGGKLPFETVNYIAEKGFKGTIFTDYADGAFLQHHLAPRILPVMDGRIDVYGSELAHEYFSSRDDPVKFFQYLNKYDVSLILLMQTEKNIPVIELLSKLPASRLLLRADDRFLFSYNPALLPSQLRQNPAQ
jgi:hypothetical protein